jgi:hypothetical protein
MVSLETISVGDMNVVFHDVEPRLTSHIQSKKCLSKSSLDLTPQLLRFESFCFMS